MASGRLDAYRAQVVAAELEECPPEVASTVVASLEGWFGVEDSARLRRRARRMLARISPDLLRQRAQRARSESSLRRWVDEPGVDTWLGTFPSEEACRAWAAIDELAQRYLADGTCERVDRARAKALTDLVTGQAAVDVQVVLTVPAATAGPDDGLVEVAAPGTTEPVLVDGGWLAQAGRARVAACDPVTGALADVGDGPGDRGVPARRHASPSWSGPGTGGAGSPAATSPPGSATSTTSPPGPPDPPPPPTWPASAAATTASSNAPAGPPPSTRTARSPGPTPLGRTRTTHPVDHLHQIQLPTSSAHPEPDPAPPGIPCLTLPDAPHSTLEHRHEHHLGAPRPRPTCRTDTHDLTPRRLRVATPSSRTRQRPRAAGRADPPPF